MNLPLIDQEREFAVAKIPVTGLASSFERQRLRFYLGLLLADTAVTLASFELASLLFKGGFIGEHLLLVAQLLLPLFLTIALQNGTYSIDSLKDWRDGAGRACAALLISAVLLYFILSFVRFHWLFSRGAFVIAIALAAIMMLIAKKVFAVVLRRRWGPNPLNMLVIDDGGPAVNLADTYFVKAAQHGLQPVLDDPHMLDLLARYVRNMDEVIVSCPPERRIPWAMVLKGCGVNGEVLSDYMREIGALGLVQRDEIGMTTLLVSTGPLGLRSRALKRAVDVAASLAVLALTLPIVLVAAAAIKLEDGGPVLFRQNRVGRRNQLFRIYKLRTMKVERSDGNGNRSASKEDERVTRAGRFLRRTSIDELPQLFNVLRGDMSLVGPRPHAIGSLAGDKLFWEVDSRYWQRHCLRPGLTGLAQIRGLRGATDREVDLTDRLQADLEYLNGWTIWRDLRILFATTMVLLHDRAF